MLEMFNRRPAGQLQLTQITFDNDSTDSLSTIYIFQNYPCSDNYTRENKR